MFEGGEDKEQDPTSVYPNLPESVEQSNAKNNQVDSLDGPKQSNMQQIEMNLKTYTREEVSMHNKETDCWMVYKNKVFDVTDFI